MSQGLKNLETLSRSRLRWESISGDSNENSAPPRRSQSFFHSQDSGFGGGSDDTHSSNGLQESQVRPPYAQGDPNQVDIEAPFTPKLSYRQENLGLSEARLDEAIDISDIPEPRPASQDHAELGGVQSRHQPRLDATSKPASEATSSQLRETESKVIAPCISADLSRENHQCKQQESSDVTSIAPYTTGTTSQSEALKSSTGTSQMVPGDHSNDPTVQNMETPMDRLDISVIPSPNSNRSVALELQRGSPCTPEDAVSSGGSSSNQPYDNESDSSYEDLQTESTRQHFILLSFISALRYKLQLQLMQAFRIKFRSDRTERGMLSTGNTSAETTSIANASTNSSSPLSSTRGGSQTRNQANSRASGKKRAADDNGEEQDDDRNSKRSRKGPSELFISPPDRRKFPCPYYKLDPITFGNTVCQHDWPDIAKLKYEQPSFLSLATR
jgi:hypothetical protein